MTDSLITGVWGQWEWRISTLNLVALGVLMLLMLISTGRAYARLRGYSPWRRRCVVALNILLFCISASILISPYKPAEAPLVVLATEGTRTLPPADHYYGLGSTAAQPNMMSTLTPLVTPGQLLLRHPQLSRLTVTGHGLSNLDWQSFSAELALQWVPPEITGLVALDWPARLRLGQALQVSGQWQTSLSEQRGLLQLVDPAGTIVDSTPVSSGAPFTLRTLPKVSGPITYHLQLLVAGELIESEPIATDVRSPLLPRLLVLQSAPSFETRQLVNWAADAGAVVVTRTSISRARQRVQRINADDIQIEPLTAHHLTPFDVVIMDGRYWQRMMPGERAIIQQAVAEGLGLVLALDGALAETVQTDAELRAWLGINVVADDTVDVYNVMHPSAMEAAPLPLSPWRIEAVTAQILTQDGQGTILDTWQSQGLGRIAVSRLRERHRWVTQGQISAYARYWTNLLMQVGRSQMQAQWLAPEAPATLRVGERLLVCANAVDTSALGFTVTYGESVPTLSPESEPLTALVPHRVAARQHCGVFWPQRQGWQRLHLFNGQGDELDAIDLRILGNHELVADRYLRRQIATQRYQQRTASRGESLTPEREPLSSLWLWIALVCTLMPLWLERRWFDLQ